MKQLKPYIFLLFIMNFVFHHSFGQKSFIDGFRVDINLNSTNKKRSYGVYSSNKYANSGYIIGYDLALRYQTKLFDFGIEYFSPFQHINASFGYRGPSFLADTLFKIIPDIKLGYSPILSKTYYGFGITIDLHRCSFGYSRIFHVKSGLSEYHGDGLNSFSFGIKLFKGIFKKKNNYNRSQL